MRLMTGSLKASATGRLVSLRAITSVFIALLISRHGVLAAEPDQAELITIAQNFCSKLGMQRNIRIVVVAENPRMVSVERLREPEEIFEMTFDRQFLRSLDSQELAAAIAHEIGHVWIFSHFPFLHTEDLANEIALKVVGQSELQSLYSKLQHHIAEQNGVENFRGVGLP